MNKRVELSVCAGIVMLGVVLGCCCWAAAVKTSSDERAQFDRDRKSILAMAGSFKVTFDMRETVPFVPDYQPIPGKVLSGDEVVKVIEDTGTTIELQHLLIVTGDEGAAVVIKHWRQSWVYEPTEILVYSSANHWHVNPLSLLDGEGRWSQTVWQTDDSPRYGGVGRWAYANGVARWESNATLRPLARRDAVRHPVYDRYLGTNRQALTPSGWVHEQDNAKIGVRDGQTVTFVHEVVINSYVRSADVDTAVADQYWDKTHEYWAAVRKTWASATSKSHGITVEEEAQHGSKTGQALMKLADRIANGQIDTSAAVAAAKTEITTAGCAGCRGLHQEAVIGRLF